MIYKGEYRDINMITWLINEKCNFHCDYCIQWHNTGALEPISLARLSEGLNHLNKGWLFHITGGEPFLEKNFINICQEIEKNHYLSLNTNLSTSNVIDFAKNIDPHKTLFINAAVHISEREKYDLKLRSYIEKLLFFQKMGFNIIAYYVAHPALFERIKADIEYLKSNGVENIRIKIFKGFFKGKYYSSSFNPKERGFLESMDADYPEFEILNKSHQYYSRMCLAGQKFFMMDRNGDLRRCSSLSKNYGNLFEKEVKFDITPRPCPIKNCGCQYEGIRNVLSTKGNTISVFKENIIEKILKVKRVINSHGVLRKVKQKVVLYCVQKNFSILQSLNLKI